VSFEPFGEIISSKLMIDDKTGENLGYGFIR
jgi:RNA recognition motif-containing protein